MPRCDWHTQEVQAALKNIVERYEKTESIIKKIELKNLDEGLPVPSINQLRYAGNHLCRFLADPDHCKKDLALAENHVKRAAYDAQETAITYYLYDIADFREAYKSVSIKTEVPDYHDYCIKIIEAQNFLSELKRDSDGDYLKEGDKHLEELEKIHIALDAASNELNKQISSNNTKATFAIAGLGVAVFSALVAALGFGYTVFCPKAKSAQPPAVSAPATPNPAKNQSATAPSSSKPNSQGLTGSKNTP